MIKQLRAHQFFRSQIIKGEKTTPALTAGAGGAQTTAAAAAATDAF